MIDWLIMGFLVLMTCQAIGEMAILYPLSGGFYALAVRMLDPAWGFAYVFSPGFPSFVEN
jgi:yeast amino acid transporter